MYMEIRKEEFMHHITNKINENLKGNKLGYKAEVKKRGLGIDIKSNMKSCPIYDFDIYLSDNSDLFKNGKLIEFNFRINEQFHLDRKVVVEGFFEESKNVKNSHIRIKRLLSKTRTLKYNLANIELKDIRYDYMDILESNGEYLKTSINEYDIDEVKPLVYYMDKEHFSIQIEITNAILCALVDVIVRIMEIELGDKNKIIVEVNREYDELPMDERYKFTGYRVSIDDLPKELSIFIKSNPNYDVRKLILSKNRTKHSIKIESKVEGYGVEITHEGNDIYVNVKEFEPDEFNIVNLHIDYTKNLDFLLDSEEFEKLLDNTVDIINKEEK